MNELYFLDKKFECRRPEPPQPYSTVNESLYQFFAVITLMLGVWYLYYRWSASLNYDALWFAIPLAFAETMMFIGTILVVINFWKINDTPRKSPPKYMGEVVEDSYKKFYKDKKIKIDIYVPVFNEDPELVRYTLKDAKKVKKLPEWDVNIYLLDDSNNEEMTKMAKEEGIEQITRDNTKGRKAGAMTYAINKTNPDFIIIIDSDTRLFENILLNTMGYFKDDTVAWVQTPQWFYDLPLGEPLEVKLEKYLGRFGKKLGIGIQKIFGKIKVGYDIFGNDPSMFFGVIQRRRNNYNASFCCGATSIHRVSALRRVAIARWVDRVVKAEDRKKALEELDIEYIVYHTSEDIYTSIVIHSFLPKRYKSVLHPYVESKMLSPLDLLTWSTQRYRYAGGTIDLVKREFKRFYKKGLTIGQKLMYFSTFWSYTGSIWLVILLLSPIIYMFTGIPPVKSYSMDFFIHLIPFLFFNQLSLMIATWGIHTNRGAKFFIAIFPIVLKAFWDVARGKPIKFVVTAKTAKSGNFLPLVKTQIAMIILYIVAVLYALTLHFTGDRIFWTGFAVNCMWAFYNSLALWTIVKAALYKFEG